MNNQNQNYLNQYLSVQLTEVKLEIHKLSTTPDEVGIWKQNGYYDGLLFRKQWLETQIDILNNLV